MRLAVVGRPGFIEAAHDVPTEELFSLCGQNTGNLVFWHAFHTHVVAAHQTFMPFGFDPAVANAHDALVLILANHVNPGLDLAGLAERLSAVTVPVIAFGLGCQSSRGEPIDALPQGSLDFFRLLASRTEVIGVRGAFTQSALARFGIDNTLVLGCISNFISGDMTGVSSWRWDRTPLVRRVGLNNDLIPDADPIALMAARVFPDAAMDIVVQAPLALLQISRNERDRVAPADRNELDRRLTLIARASRRQRRDLGERLYAFFDARAWLEHVRRYDLMLGSRMHGNMVAFQAGVPTVFVPHDSRTEEMVETMHLPSFELGDCERVRTPDAFLERVRFDPALYLDTRAMLKQRYVSLLRGTGLTISPALARL